MTPRKGRFRHDGSDIRYSTVRKWFLIEVGTEDWGLRTEDWKQRLRHAARIVGELLHYTMHACMHACVTKCYWRKRIVAFAVAVEAHQMCITLSASWLTKRHTLMNAYDAFNARRVFFNCHESFVLWWCWGCDRIVIWKRMWNRRGKEDVLRACACPCAYDSFCLHGETHHHQWISVKRRGELC